MADEKRFPDTRITNAASGDLAESGHQRKDRVLPAVKDSSPMTGSLLTDNEALELLAFLVTAARCLVDEPVDYGPMRLLSAAERLSSKVAARIEDRTTRGLFEDLAREIPPQLGRRNGDPDGYVRFMDESCRRIAMELSRRASRAR